MVLDIAMTVLGVVVVGAGFVGCILPVLPGPPVSFLGLILVSLAGGWDTYSTALLIVLAVVSIVVTALDYILPAVTSKRAGAGKPGVWGSVIGLLVGMIFFPPFGLIIGAFVGAVLAEAIFNHGKSNPWRAGLGVFAGTMLGTLLKLATSGVIAFYFVRGAIGLYG
jgi:uncharacterized protein